MKPYIILNQSVRCYFDFSLMTQVIPIVLYCLLWSLQILCLPCVNSFGNKLEKTGKIWKCLSECEPPPIKKMRHKEDGQESNSTCMLQKKEHTYFRTVRQKGDHDWKSIERTFLFPFNKLEIVQGQLNVDLGNQESFSPGFGW